MPLLKRRVFRRASANELLRDEDEVFHCEITDEIFKDYEEYCERIILVNSMVWSCEMTGKPNLTYAEALESERNARKSLRDFPMELRIPILYLANRTKRSSLADMLEDVFNFVRERYFVGETVEACLEGDVWSEAHVLSVTAPKHISPTDAASPVKPASMYCYEVEQWDVEDAGAVGQMGTAPSDRVRRRKGIFTREKNKLFIKQFVELSPSGVFVLKRSALDKYNIHKVKFEQLFTGAPPEFPTSKKLLKSSLSPAAKLSPKPGSSKLAKGAKRPSPDKKGQQSIAKYVTKTEKFEGTKQSKAMEVAPGPSLKEEMARAGAAMQQRKLDEKERKKEQKARLAAYIKEWHRQKDDLDLEDHKVLPKATPVDIDGIPQRYFGDFLAVLEFVHLYADTLKTKDVFHNGIDIEVLRRALTQKESAGVFSDVIQMLLTTIFSLMEEESEEVNESGIHESTGNMDMEAGSKVTKAVELATKASKWPQTYLATPLCKLPLDAFTVSEVLRLHLLSSGATPWERCARWRYQQRGGYSSLDDAGLHLRLAHPHVIRNLASVHVADLPLEDKFRIVQCLMNQILSYASLRDIIEEKLDAQRSVKHELRMLQATERKRDTELTAARIKLNKEARQKREAEVGAGGGGGAEGAEAARLELQAALDALEKEHELKKAENEKKIKELQAQCFDYLSYLGMDRAYRSYWLNQSVPGLFVELGEAHVGPCRDRPVLPVAPPADTLQYVQKLFESERGASDKENDSANTSRANSPKKQANNLNGLSQKLSALEANTQRMQELLVCTGSGATCPVHGPTDVRPRWWVYHEGRQVEELVGALNKRGLRELDLKHNLEMDMKSIIEYVEKCPVHMLNAALHPPPVPTTTTTRAKKLPSSSISVPVDSSLSEALELSLRDYILELEEKVFHGCLGALKVKDREAWRGTILLRSYDKQAKYLTWGPNRQYRDDYHLPNGKTTTTPQVKESESDEDVKPVLNNYRDPGTYLEERGLAAWAGNARLVTPSAYNDPTSHLHDVKIINGGMSPLKESWVPRVEVKWERTDAQAGARVGAGSEEEHQKTVRALASALLQISQSIHHKYLKRPLGYDEKDRKEQDTKNKPLDFRALERWEVSLMECRSFAQVALHLLTLDSSVMWSASILNASCRLCRRKTDGDNMLLCDGCNKGHHMYCLKPKITKVPEGDWFCDQCKPKVKIQTPRKKRRLFNDDVQEEQEEEVDDCSETCTDCGSGGQLVVCVVCRAGWHFECAQPGPLRNQTRSWKCALCILSNRRENTGTRRCHAEAINNIHQMTRELNNASRLSSTGGPGGRTIVSDGSLSHHRESESSEENVVLLKVKGRRVRDSKESSPAGSARQSLTNGHAGGKRSRKSADEAAPPAKKSRTSAAALANGHVAGSISKKSIDTTPSSKRRSKSSASSTPVLNGDHEVSIKASKSKRSSRGPTLHADALKELLRDVMRHRDAWPFCEPVSTDEVPDYLEVVSEPMDFQTMSEKLSQGEYASDERALRDAALVFHDCYLYNRDTHPIARAGARLEKYFRKRCADLELPALPELEPAEKVEPEPTKSKRVRRDK